MNRNLHQFDLMLKIPRQEPHELTDAQVMIFVRYNIEEMLNFEFLPYDHAVDANLYFEQLHRIYDVLPTCYPALVNSNTLDSDCNQGYGVITVLPHEAYRPDCAPSDYGHFWSMEHLLHGKQFETFDEVEIVCREFFDYKPKQ